MAEIKADATHEHRLIVAEADISHQKLHKPGRVASLDIFRGLTVAVSLSSFLLCKNLKHNFVYAFLVPIL